MNEEPGYVTPRELHGAIDELRKENDQQHREMGERVDGVDEKVTELLVGQATTNAMLQDGKRTMERLGYTQVDHAEKIAALEEKIGSIGRVRRWIGKQMDRPFVAPLVVAGVLALVGFGIVQVKQFTEKVDELCSTKIDSLNRAFDRGTYNRTEYVAQLARLQRGDCN